MTRAALEFRTIPALVRASAERFPDLDGLVDGDLRLTFPELAARIEDRGLRASYLARSEHLRTVELAVAWGI